MGCGSWCAYYKDRNKSVAMCRYCPDYDKNSVKPRQVSGNLGISKSADGSTNKRNIESPTEFNSDIPQRDSKSSKGRWCFVCKQYSVYHFGDHWECLNVKGGIHDTRSASQKLTEDTKTWNQQ